MSDISRKRRRLQIRQRRKRRAKLAKLREKYARASDPQQRAAIAAKARRVQPAGDILSSFS